METINSLNKTQFSIHQNKLLINGKFKDSHSQQTFDSINPATEEAIASVALAEFLGQFGGIEHELRHSNQEKNAKHNDSQTVLKIANLSKQKYAVCFRFTVSSRKRSGTTRTWSDKGRNWVGFAYRYFDNHGSFSSTENILSLWE